MKKRNFKAFSILLVLTMLVSLMPGILVSAAAEGEITTYDFTTYSDATALPSGFTYHTGTITDGFWNSASGENEGEYALKLDTAFKTQRVNFPAWTEITTGKFKVKVRFMVDAETAKTLSFNIPGKLNSYRPGWEAFDQATVGTWQTLEILADVDKGKVIGTIDGTTAFESADDDPLLWKDNGGANGLYIANWNAGTGNVYISKIEVIRIYEAPEINSVAFYDMDGGEYTGEVKATTSKLVVNFSEELGTNAAESITVEDSDGNETGTVSISGKTATFKFDNFLKANTDYTVTAKAGLLSAQGNATESDEEYEFTTDAGDVFGNVIVSSEVNASDSDKYYYIYKNTFDTQAEFDVVGENAGAAGRYENGMEAVWDDGAVKVPSPVTGNRLSYSFGGYLGMSDQGFEISLDIKSEESENGVYFQLGSNTSDISGSFDFDSDVFGGTVKTGEWNTYHIKVYPNNTSTSQYFKAWVGDDESLAKQHSYTVGSRTYVNKIRLLLKKTTETPIYFDNLTVKRDRVMYYNPFNSASDLELTGQKINANGLVGVSGGSIDNGTLYVPASNNNAKPIQAGVLLNDHMMLLKYKISFYLKLDEGTKLHFNPCANTGDIPSPEKCFSLVNNNSIGGDEPTYGEFQKYNVVVYPGAADSRYFYVWRGEGVAIPTNATAYYYTLSTDSRTNFSWWRFVSEGATEFWMDDLKYEVYDEDYVPGEATIDASSIKANVINTTGLPQDIALIYAEYDEDGAVTGIKVNSFTVPADTVKMVETLPIESYENRNVYKARGFLWRGFESLIPLTEKIVIK